MNKEGLVEVEETVQDTPVEEVKTEEKRKRRSTRFSGDFAVEYGDIDFSDDERGSKKKKSSAVKEDRKSKRKECPGCGASVNISIKECKFCDYQFTSKSLTSGANAIQAESLFIRETFPFEPERDEDGSLIIAQILGRRIKKTGKRWTRG